jgi:hypothetical protein
MKTLVLFLALIVTSPAFAQGIPDSRWVVGTTEDLESQRYATNALFCEALNAAAGYAVISCPQYQWLGDHPYGLGEVDCVQIGNWWWTDEQAPWNPLTYVDQTWQGLESYHAADVVDAEGLPEVCRTFIIEQTCGPLEDEWAGMMCEWGELICCSE